MTFPISSKNGLVKVDADELLAIDDVNEFVGLDESLLAALNELLFSINSLGVHEVPGATGASGSMSRKFPDIIANTSGSIEGFGSAGGSVVNLHPGGIVSGPSTT